MQKRKYRIIMVLIAISFMLANLLFSDLISPNIFEAEKDVKATVYVDKANLEIGDKFKIFVEILVPEGYHITDNDDFFYLDTENADKYKFSKPIPSAKVKYKEQVVYKGTVSFTSEGTYIKDSTIEGNELLVGFQICTEIGDESCFMPAEIPVKLDFSNVSADLFEEKKIIKSITEIEEDNDESLEEKLFDKISVDEDASDEVKKTAAMALKWSFWIFLAAFLGGILDSLTPCVYPIIPVVISYMGAKSSGKKSAGFILSLFFVLGLAFTYSIVGLGASFLGSQFGMGSLAANPWVLGFVATVFILLSLSMFGFYDINLLTSDRKSKLMSSNFTGVFGAMFLGAISGIIAAPCVGPVLAALLMHVALVGDMFYGWALFMTFAFGLGLLFIVIGTFSGAINSLPQAGAWMVSIKKFFGIIMVGAAIFFIKIFIPDWFLFGLIGTLLILLSTYIGAFKKLEVGASLVAHLGKTLGIIALVVGLIYITISLDHFVDLPFSTKNISITSVSGSAGSNIHKKVPFYKTRTDMNVIKDAVAKAKAENKLIIVDFWAEWCGNCIEMDKTAWVDKEIIEYIDENYIPIKIDFTDVSSDFSKKYMKMFEKYSVNNPPMILFLDGEGKVIGNKRGLVEPERMLKKLKKIVEEQLRITN